MDVCESVQDKRYYQPPFEKIEDCLEDVLRELKHVRVDVLRLKGDFLDSAVEYETSDEEEEKGVQQRKKRKAKDFRLTAKLPLVSRFSRNLIHAVCLTFG